MQDINIRSEETPNPNARRYLVNRAVQDQAKGRFFVSGSDAQEPLADALLAVEGVAAVMLLPGSVTVTKENGTSWEAVEPAALTVIDRQLA